MPEKPSDVLAEYAGTLRGKEGNVSPCPLLFGALTLCMGNPLSMEMQWSLRVWPFAESKGTECAANADHSWACQVPRTVGTTRKLGEKNSVTRKFHMGGRRWLLADF